MASPFPGVDPYIEAQGYWQDFHTRFITYACDALNEILPESYVAQLGEHLRLAEMPGRQSKRVLPDVTIVGGERPALGAGSRERKGARTAVLEPVKVPLPSSFIEVRDAWIEIRRGTKRKPIASIEVLSPTNKVGVGFGEYLAKRRKSIRQKIHLVELDLLLRGERLPMERPLPPGDFYALVSRSEERPESDVYSWTIRDPLPSIPIPLCRPDPDVMLDLGAVFATAYERARYGRLIDYTVPPSTVKKAADRAWAERTARVPRR
jgi:Protein of unknown function (DUF4058)